MFTTAGLTIEWRPWKTCPPDAIPVRLHWNAQDSDHPLAFAYAMPYESRIVLFWDRVEGAADPQTLPLLLAHVLVHEVTHILQGLAHHSARGVMKASFSKADIAEMRSHPLPFTNEDVQLIHVGMKSRQTRLARTGQLPVSSPAGAASSQ
jgi:hypothetical protein